LAENGFYQNGIEEAMMKRFSIFATILVLSLGTTLVFAQEYADSTEYSFDDDVVEGDLVRPDGEMTVVRKKGKQRSLIKVRTHFVPEMLKSVEDI
jgi:hypothetical protein